MMKTILYADDRADDVFFLERTCRRAGLDQSLRIKAVSNGALAIEYLSGNGGYADRAAHPLPDVVLLDLKMPMKSGFEVLEWIRATPAVSALPVFVLTSSNLKSDFERSQALGADGFLVKSGDLTSLRELLVELHKAARDRPPAPRRIAAAGQLRAGGDGPTAAPGAFTAEPEGRCEA